MAIRLDKGKEKLIVMPFVQVVDQDPNGYSSRKFDGRGLGLHFLAGNLICLYGNLLECWFGWRVQNIFPDVERFLSYCSKKGSAVDFKTLGQREKVRFWIEGEYAGGEAGGRLDLVLHDTRDGLRFERRMAYSHDDYFLGFCRTFFDWLDQAGLGFSGREFTGRNAGHWPERISPQGLDALGKALGTLYAGYVNQGKTPPGQHSIDLKSFRRAVDTSPESYLAWDLLGWALYKNDDLAGAVNAFDAALALNPSGMGAHAGRMWIALAVKDRQTALHHALEKARCRGEKPEKARAFVAKKLD